MRPEHDDTRLDKARNDRGDSRARGPEPREAEIAEDQQGVEAEIHHNGHDARNHGHDGLARLAQRAGIALRQRKRDKADEHDEQIFLCIAEAGRDLLRGAVTLEVQEDQVLAEQQENARAEHRKGRADEQLEAERLPHAVPVALAVILRTENARAGHRTEDGEVKHKDQLIDDGNAGHLLRADAADHNIIQQADEVCDAVLDHDGDCNGERHFIERRISDVFLSER